MCALPFIERRIETCEINIDIRWRLSSGGIALWRSRNKRSRRRYCTRISRIALSIVRNPVRWGLGKWAIRSKSRPPRARSAHLLSWYHRPPAIKQRVRRGWEEGRRENTKYMNSCMKQNAKINIMIYSSGRCSVKATATQSWELNSARGTTKRNNSKKADYLHNISHIIRSATNVLNNSRKMWMLLSGSFGIDWWKKVKIRRVA